MVAIDLALSIEEKVREELKMVAYQQYVFRLVNKKFRL